MYIDLTPMKTLIQKLKTDTFSLKENVARLG